jgi:hypothetical protein
MVSLGIFSVASYNSMCPGSTQALKMSTSIFLGVALIQYSAVTKFQHGGRRATRTHGPVMGLLYLFSTFSDHTRVRMWKCMNSVWHRKWVV